MNPQVAFKTIVIHILEVFENLWLLTHYTIRFCAILCKPYLFAIIFIFNQKFLHMDTTSLFQTLSPLPIPLYLSQCVVHKHEILICGGEYKRDCYSYHILKDQYKRICSYPKDVTPRGHCIVKYISNENIDEVNLLSLGGVYEHSLIMKYVSVWNDNDVEMKKMSDRNEWLPFTDNQNKSICISKKKDGYEGMRAVIGGSNNHLLFIFYFHNNIDVFDLNLRQYINHNTLPMDMHYIFYHCFVLKKNYERTSTKKNLNSKKNEMLLFCENVGLSIDYDESSNTFQFHKLWVCTTMRTFRSCAYVCINDFILFFGGWNGYISSDISQEVHKYSMKEKKWIKFEQKLPFILRDFIGVLNEDSTCIHFLGGRDKKDCAMSVHITTNISEWTKKETEKEREWMAQEEGIREGEEIKVEIESTRKELKGIKQGFDITKLKVELLSFFFSFFCSLSKSFYNILIFKKKKKKKKKTQRSQNDN
ncbi:hypothetical protein RFI_07173 [Reticulomyxa filosa]|uniref:Kelch domain-containing protein n=1 Tax=Reticulomyxa filosa TaxID=46433 RepID=X6NUH2_RETFI|nr:hypothetical protein RFI_07173 [Reticulomyxa filosa]|eukprot:ETO29945.1 hypothetical protein RFI_07173 [Reticulomyxa filosa]